MGDADPATTLRRVAEELDLGEYEIETYLAVLGKGDLTAAEIAEETDVPQPRVYDTVRSLADRGLVELRESRPLRVVAIDPEEAFDGIRSTMDDLVTALEARFTAPARDTEAVALVKSRTTILRYLEDVIESAEYELTLSFTPDLLERFEAHLADASDRGVRIELVVAPAAEAPDGVDYARVATSARGRRGITTPVIAVADGEYSVYATPDALHDGTEKYGVIFNRSALGFVLVAFFGTVIWTTADVPLGDTPQARDFPRRYASIRRCVKEIRELDPGANVVATIEGRDVVTGEPRTVAGRVVDTHYTEDQEVATLVIEADGDRIEVGGRVAAYEDIEAHTIEVKLGGP